MRGWIGYWSCCSRYLSSCSVSLTFKVDQCQSQVQLEQFFVRIRDELQVSRMQHFEYVQSEDLEKVGMSKPAAKRLLDIIKRRRLKSKLTKFLPTVGKFGTLKRWGVATLIYIKPNDSDL